jgi:hypothetical protein
MSQIRSKSDLAIFYLENNRYRVMAPARMKEIFTDCLNAGRLTPKTTKRVEMALEDIEDLKIEHCA